MAVNPLSLAESLRPWRAAGVTHFLREALGDEDAATLHAQALPAAISDGSAARMSAASSGQPRREAEAAQAPKGGSHQAATPAGAPPGSPDVWPPAWQALFAQTRPAPVIWTYPELGLDLSGRGSKERSVWLHGSIDKLNWPRGTSAFWPLCLGEECCGDEGDVAPEAAVFKAGLHLLQPKVVVLVGARAARLADAGLTLRTPFTSQIVRGMLFVLVPDFVALLESPSLTDATCEFLRIALRGVNIVFQERRP